MLEIYDLTCEYKRNPIGLGARIPRIGWKLKGDSRGTRQTAYRLQVSPDADFAAAVWDSGRVESDRSVHVEPEGLELRPRTRYYYRVEAWNERGESSGWSTETAYWETGLFEPAEWEAEWIAAPAGLDPERPEAVPMLRKAFRIEGEVRSARVYATALGLYELELNGRRVGDHYFAPGWTSYDKRLQYQAYDVTDLLVSGDNVVGAWLGNGWYKGYLGWDGYNELYGDRTALLLQLHIGLINGHELVVKSDGSWQAATGPILLSELYHGETYDARLEREGWSSPSGASAGWSPVEVLERDYRILVPQENVPARKIEELRPIALLKTPEGDTVIDMGQNMVGWVRFTVRGEAGREVELRHAEVLDREGNFYLGNIRAAKQTIRYAKKSAEPETYEPRFTFQGFRYVRLTGFEEPIRLEDFAGIVVHSDMEATGSFECSDPLVNQLQHNILWGLKGNFLDVPTDCPQRDERLGWTGDAQVFARTAAYLVNSAPFFAKWLGDLKADQAPDGGVPYVVPHMLEKKPSKGDFPPPFNSAAWGDAATIVPWTVYLCYGDKRILETQYESMKAWVEFIRRQGDNEFLWDTGFHFADWLALDAKPGAYMGATDMHYVSTAYYAYSTDIVRKAASVLGKPDDEREYAALYEGIRRAFLEEYVTPSGRLAVPTQTAQVIGLYFGLLEGKAKEKAIAKLMQLLADSDFHLTTGFVGTPYLNHALSDNGQNEAAYRVLLQRDFPSWLYQVTKGATTIWEHWDGIREDGTFWSDAMNSFNHYAYGAIGDWLYRSVAGIDTDEEQAGYKKIVIRPRPGNGLSWAEGRLKTMYGTIVSRWSKSENGRMEANVTVPANTTAEIVLPGAASAAEVTESGIPLAEAEGIESVEGTESGVKFSAQAGKYSFVYSLR
ncbi:family 78 glycoside hydrolase catalytic domain [Cohnella thailandensis]|uniref:alpha-L-rhamnosidase n=1 Tax=Cohnella thailandensis TaxID=557557 RepID=A0A841T031_9BACL|nr:family 78 glycoside hydrolase catalytic domain [Cohnella thailandensis]MBB6637793.1 family 78 glycoside hydrolase catalytic domain [Cohnella thailandensis]MBP1974028.1 alpha-L-rhamnosidase [Cohnella thailandensis]